MNGWIGVDLDGTLAHYEGWQGETHIGAPISAMVERVKRWLGDYIAANLDNDVRDEKIWQNELSWTV